MALTETKNSFDALRFVRLAPMLQLMSYIFLGI